MTSSPAHPLSWLIGRWQGQEIIHPTSWGPGGVTQARIECREELGGKLLVQSYQAERDGSPWLKAHALFALDPAGGCSLFWFDSFGFVPSEPAVGQRESDSLSFVRVSPRGRTRHVYTLRGDDAYALSLQSSFDEGASWSPVMDGSYTRA